MRLAVWGCLFYVVPKLTWFLIAFVQGLFRTHFEPAVRQLGSFYVARVSDIFFPLFMILAFRCFLRDRLPRTTTTPPPE
jgi:hypothetical protein